MLNILRRENYVGVREYCDFDTQERFERNKRTQPIHWPYHTKPVTYTINSQGYRGPELDTVDWAESIVVFGCSFTFGVGLDDSDTLPVRLSRILGVPVVNMGLGGGSAMHMWTLTTQLVDQGVRPKAVVYIWPGSNRVALFKDANYHEAWGPWTTNPTCNIGGWSHKFHGEKYLSLAKASVGQQWGKDTPISHWTWSEHVYNTCGKFTGPQLVKTDLARDLEHPGVESVEAWAQTIAAQHRV